MPKPSWFRRSRDAFDHIDRAATAVGWVRWLLGTWFGNAVLSFMLSTATAISAWVSDAPGWQIALASLVAFAVALWLVRSALGAYNAIRSGRWGKNKPELQIVSPPWVDSAISQDGNKASRTGVCYIRVKNIADDATISSVRVQISECSCTSLLLALSLRSYDHGVTSVPLAPEQIELFEVFSYHIANGNKAVLSFYGRENTLEIEQGQHMMIGISAFGMRSASTERFRIGVTRLGILEMISVEQTPSVMEFERDFGQQRTTAERFAADAAAEKIRAIPQKRSHLPPELSSIRLLGRSVDIRVTDATLCMITDSIKTVEKEPMTTLWPIRRRIPVAIVGLWFERADGRQFDIVLRNLVLPGQVGTRGASRK